MKITLVIPNYNGAQNLENIITQVLKEDFDHVYVIDDNSSDNSLEIVKNYSKVVIIEGKENKGPAGNRNRVLDHECGNIIMFLDVDMKLMVENLRAKIEKSFDNNNTGVVGGLIVTQKNEPMWWNYGFEMHLIRDAKADIVHSWALDNWNNAKKIYKLKEKYKEVTPNLEISFDSPKNKKVDWVSEANFCIRSDLFKKIGGFDINMRYHADQDLCKRVRDLGYTVMFSPEIVSMHMEIDTFGKNREKLIKENAYYFYRKHWGMTRDIFDRLYSEIK